MELNAKETNFASRTFGSINGSSWQQQTTAQVDIWIGSIGSIMAVAEDGPNLRSEAPDDDWDGSWPEERD